MIIINEELSKDEHILLDNGYYYGFGVFETILVLDKPVFLKQHLERLNQSLSQLKMKQSVKKEYVCHIIDKFRIKNCALKLSVSTKNIILATRPISYKEEDYHNGFRVKISDIRRNQYSHMTYIKSFNFLDNIYERELAVEEGYNEVLFLNHNAHIAEGSISNLFFVKDNQVYTPSVECGLLNGIIRQWVLNTFNVTQGTYTLDNIMSSDGIFLTNSLMGIMPVRYIMGQRIDCSQVIGEIRNRYNDQLKEFRSNC